MPLNEFEIIKKYFQRVAKRTDVIIGSGDDCAIVQVPPKHQLAMSIDTFASGVHFSSDTTAGDIAYKALAINLSDLAAMGAQPAWFTCALAIPDVNELWLKQFAEGLFSLADQFNITLVGGDLTRGALSITINVCGLTPENKFLTRAGANVGDYIYVSGNLGTAAYALKYHDQISLSKLNRPLPRIELGLQLRDIASSCIDISDGLISDLGHILEASDKGASIYLDKIPMLELVKKYPELALTGGDDYELCFTSSQKLDLPDVTCIGKIDAEKGLRMYNSDGSLYEPKKTGYQHF